MTDKTQVDELTVRICRGMRLLRKQLDLSQEAMAIELGVTSRTIKRWESSVAIPFKKLVELKERGFNVDLILHGYDILPSPMTDVEGRVLEIIQELKPESKLKVLQAAQSEFLRQIDNEVKGLPGQGTAAAI